MDRQQFINVRKSWKLTQKACAEKLGISLSTIRSWEYGIAPVPKWVADRSMAWTAVECATRELKEARAEIRHLKLMKSRRPPPSATGHPSHRAQAVYRELAKKYHPDLNPANEEFMRDLNQLWQAVRLA